MSTYTRRQTEGTVREWELMDGVGSNQQPLLHVSLRNGGVEISTFLDREEILFMRDRLSRWLEENP